MKYIKRYEKSINIDEILLSLSESDWRDLGNLGFHGGTLGGKSDYLESGYRGDLPFTGYYFYSDFKRAYHRGNRRELENNEVRIIDIGGNTITSARYSSTLNYNLYKPYNSDDYWRLKTGLKNFYFDIVRKDKEFDDALTSFSNTFLYYHRLKEIITNNRDNIYREWVKWRKKLISYTNSSSTNWRLERFETVVMKILGYDGVDNRKIINSTGTANPDSSSEGSVIFDLKEDTVYTKEEFYNKFVKGYLRVKNTFGI